MLKPNLSSINHMTWYLNRISYMVHCYSTVCLAFNSQAKLSRVVFVWTRRPATGETSTRQITSCIRSVEGQWSTVSTQLEKCRSSMETPESRQMPLSHW